MRKSLLIFFLSGLAIAAQAQNNRKHTSNVASWWAYTGTHKFAPKWGLHLEGQVRRAGFLADDQQLFARTGITYFFHPEASATVGYAFAETWPYGEFGAKSKFPEHRIWEQIQLKHQISRFEVISRFRLEQRFVKSPVASGADYAPGPAVYTNRFRLLTRASVPFKGTKIVDKSWYFSFFDEIFANFGKNVQLNIFDQNRAYVGIGYKIPKVGRLEAGYMNQLLIKGDGLRVENNHTISVSLAAAIDFKRKAAK